MLYWPTSFFTGVKIYSVVWPTLFIIELDMSPRDIKVVLVKDKGSEELEHNICLKHNGEIALIDEKGRELERFKVPYGAVVMFQEGSKVQAGANLFAWDPHRTPILAEVCRY